MLRILLTVVLAIFFCWSALADETDQFLSLGVELSDAAPTINAYLEREIGAILDRANAEADPDCACEMVVQNIYERVYVDRVRQSLLYFIEDTESIELYPERDVSKAQLLEMSIYRDVTFPYAIRVTRTIRLGDVYLGLDKLTHFFGLGRRFYQLYLVYVSDGLSPQEALEKTIEWGILSEETILGNGVNGIFSYADLEANYQGLRFARDFCEGDMPFLRHNGEEWILSHPVRFEDYITPGFDETYNPPDFKEAVGNVVLPILLKEYANKMDLPEVRKRFSIYERATDSDSTLPNRSYFRDAGQRQGKLDVFAILKFMPNYVEAP